MITTSRAPYQPYTMAAVHKASRKKRFTVVSMFAGGGGSSIGYRLAGGSVLLVNEFVKEAVRTYCTNFPETVVDTRDIRKINGTKDKGKHIGPVRFIEQVGLAPKELDVLDGSPPCKSFSQAGRGQKERHEKVVYSDTRQSGVDTLFYDFFYLAKRILPKVIVAENVPALANAKNEDLFDAFLSSMRYRRHLTDRSQDIRASYASYAVLDASLFGVPQKRKRLFVIGIRKDVAHKIGIKSDEAVAAVFPTPPNMIVSIRNAFEGLRQTPQEAEQWRAALRESFLLHPTLELPTEPSKIIGLSDKSKYFQLKRAAWDLPCSTLTQQGQKMRGTAGVIHPKHDRKFTLSELKRLFSLPDDYKLTGTVDSGAERICRMVCPLVSKAIAESIYQTVLLPYRAATN